MGGDLDALRTSEDRVPPELHQTTWVTDQALEFIDQKRSGPWFLTLNPYDPHPPFIPPRAYAERFDPAAMPGPHFRESGPAQQERLRAVEFQTLAERPETFYGRSLQALYYAMITQVDEQFTRLLAGLEASGQRDDTVIVFTSDHGEMLGDHGLLYKGCRFYEGLVRVPLVFSWPGRIRRDLRTEALVELIDLSATPSGPGRDRGARGDAGPELAADPDGRCRPRPASPLRALRVFRCPRRSQRPEKSVLCNHVP